MSAPAISLVVSTLGRRDELAHLFDSLDRQGFRDFEVLVVDQNDDDRLATLLAERRWSFPLRRLATPGERGLSHGRNRGWRETAAPILLFPDDDCWYPASFLERAMTDMATHGCDILSGRAADEAGRSINGRYEPTAQAISRANVFTTQIEWVVFVRRTVLEALGGYDEGIGVGSPTPWQAAEGPDLTIRAVDAGFTCRFDPALAGHHAELDIVTPDRAMRRKARAYGRGAGHVLRKHRYGVAERLKWLVRPLGGALLSLPRNPARAGYYANVLLGRFEGMIGRTLG